MGTGARRAGSRRLRTWSGASTDTTLVPRGEIRAAFRGSMWKAKTASMGAPISVLTVISGNAWCRGSCALEVRAVPNGAVDDAERDGQLQ